MRRTALLVVSFLLLTALQTFAGEDIRINGSMNLTGDLNLSGPRGQILFPDGTTQGTAILMGPTGPQGRQGDPGPPGATGPQGPAGPNLIDSSTSTPLTGLLKGTGGAVGPAVAGSDYLAPTGSGSQLTGVLKPSDIYNGLDSSETEKPLAAAQGKVLNDILLKLQGTVYPLESYGDATSGTTLQTAIFAISLAGGGTITCKAGTTISLSTTLFLKSNVLIDLNGATLKWTGGASGEMVTNDVTQPPLKFSGMYGGYLDPGPNAAHVFKFHSIRSSYVGNLVMLTGNNDLTFLHLLADAQQNDPTDGVRNTVYNVFGPFISDNRVSGVPKVKNAIVLEGFNDGGSWRPVTLNRFVGPMIFFAAEKGYVFRQYCDSNLFEGMHSITLTATGGGGKCVVFNDSATPDQDVDVWGEHFAHLSCETWYPDVAGQEAVVINRAGGIVIDYLSNDRPNSVCWGSNFVIDNYSKGHAIAYVKGYPYNSIERIVKGDVRVTGTGSGIIFPDSSKQTTAGGAAELPVASSTVLGGVKVGTNLSIDGTGVLSGAGNVAGPASATDNAIARFDTATGKVIQNSSATIDDNGKLITAAGQFNGTTTSYTPGLRVNGTADSALFAVDGTLTGTMDYPAGVYVNTTYKALNPSFTAYGVASTPKVSDVAGVSQNVLRLYGLFARPELKDTYAGTVTSAYALAAGNPNKNGGTGVFTNAYGLFVENITSGASNYAIYTGTGASSFGDAIALRTSAAPPATGDQTKLWTQDDAAGESRLHILSEIGNPMSIGNQTLALNNAAGGNGSIQSTSHGTKGKIYLGSPTATTKSAYDESAARLGIGTDSPSETLEVAGNIKATAFIGDGSGLTTLPASPTFSGTVTASTFAGSGGSLTGITAGQIAFAPAGTLSATTAQGAIEELKAERKYLDIIEDFGAVPDSNGTHGNGTDNHDAIVNAITSASTTGKPLYVPKGIYRSAASVSVSGIATVKIYGEGHIFIDDDSATNGFALSSTGKTTGGTVELSGLKFTRYSTGVKRTPNLFLLFYQLSKLHISNIDVSGASSMSLMPHSCGDVVIENSYVHDSMGDGDICNLDGISLYNCDNTRISGNHVWNTGDDGIAVSTGGTHAVISGNIVTNVGANNCGGGIKVASSMQNVTINDNILSANSGAGISLINESYSPGPQKNISIKDNMIMGNTTFRGVYSSGAGIHVTNRHTTYPVSEVDINGNTLMGGGISVGAYQTTDYSELVKNINISNNRVFNTGFDGIYARYVDDLTIKNNSIYAPKHNGILVSDVKTSLSVTGNDIHDYSTDTAGANGIKVGALFTGAKFWFGDNTVSKIDTDGGAELAVTPTPDPTPGGGSSVTFAGLADAPSSYAGAAGKVIQVNSGATGLEFGQTLGTTSNAVFNRIGLGGVTAPAYGIEILTSGVGAKIKRANGSSTDFSMYTDSIFNIDLTTPAGVGPTINFNPKPTDSTQSASVRMFRDTASIYPLFSVFAGDNTNTVIHQLGGRTLNSYLSNHTGRLGIGTSAPDRKVEINSATGENLRLTYNDADGSAASRVDLTTSAAGNLTITPSGGTVSVAGTLSATAFNGDGSALTGIAGQRKSFLYATDADYTIGTNSENLLVTRAASNRLHTLPAGNSLTQHFVVINDSNTSQTIGAATGQEIMLLGGTQATTQSLAAKTWKNLAWTGTFWMMY